MVPPAALWSRPAADFTADMLGLLTSDDPFIDQALIGDDQPINRLAVREARPARRFWTDSEQRRRTETQSTLFHCLMDSTRRTFEKQQQCGKSRRRASHYLQI